MTHIAHRTDAAIVIHVQRSVTDAGEAVHMRSFNEFRNEIVGLLDAEATDKKQLPAIAAIDLTPNTPRKNANVQRVTVGLLDFDHIADVARVRERLSGLDYLVYATPSDAGVGAPERRIRICVALERPLLPREVGAWRLALAAEIGETLDSSTIDPARLSFVGRLEGTTPREHWIGEGEPCPVDGLLALRPAPTIDRGSSPAPAISGRDLTTDERARLDQVAAIIDPLYIPGTPDNASNTHQLSRALAGLCRHKGLPQAAAEYLILECLPTNNPEQKAKNIQWAYEHADNPDGWRGLAREFRPM